MSDGLGLLLKARGKLPTCIVKYGQTYSLVGSMPIELCEKKQNSIYQDYYASKTWDSLDAAIDAVKSVGITRFQLPDCSWYEV